MIRETPFRSLAPPGEHRAFSLHDDPPETWESESLAHLDSALYGQFDLDERLGAIKEKLAYLQDAGATFLGLLETRKNQRLEWVIILLIVVEIFLSVGKDLFRFLFPIAR